MTIRLLPLALFVALIAVASPASGGESRPADAGDSALEVRIRTALDEETKLEFPNTELRDVLMSLADYHNINIIPDEQAITDEGASLDDEVNLVIGGITLRSALGIVLGPRNLTYVVEDEVMKITTRAEAARTVVTRGYDVTSLTGGDAGDVAQVVEALLGPDRRVRGFTPPQAAPPAPELRVVPFHGLLLVTASELDHGRVEDLLRLMGRAKTGGEAPGHEAEAAEPAK